MNLRTTFLPQFITFTGADEHADIAHMVELSRMYSIEWGILFSPKRQGTGRYPPMKWISEIVPALRHRLIGGAHMRFAAHLCGGYSADILQYGGLPIYKSFDPADLMPHFARVQINTTEPLADIDRIVRWLKPFGARAIFQTRGQFPIDQSVQWLFDVSGGRGITPIEWPAPRNRWEAEVLKGYAGGLGPDNVAAAVQTIGEWDPMYWLDMESRVRDENDRFDLNRCEQVCRAVYGDRS